MARMTEQAAEIAGQVILTFSQRKGFDDWWLSMDEEFRQEILHELHDVAFNIIEQG